MSLKRQLKKVLNKVGLFRHTPPVNGVNFGDLKRTTPFSTEFGYDRGGPVDRYYIENFLEKCKEDIHGDVLEIGDNDYTLRFGGAKIAKSYILHVDDKNAAATYVGDLSNAPHIPDSKFDCIVLTQTLHLIYDFKAAIATCYRILKPGGVLLMTVPGISNIDYSEWNHLWLWSFTDSAMKKVLAESFPTANYEVDVFGNVMVATAFLYGMGLPEIEKQKMDVCDPHYQVIITARAVK